MSNWLALTEDHVLDGMGATAAEVIRTNAGVSGEDPMPGLLVQTTGKVRGAIRSHADNRLPADETLIPPSAIPHAAALVRHALLTKLGEEVSEAVRDQYKEALAWLNLVRNGTESIEAADGDGTEVKATASPKITARTKRFGRDSQDGI